MQVASLYFHIVFVRVVDDWETSPGSLTCAFVVLPTSVVDVSDVA